MDKAQQTQAVQRAVQLFRAGKPQDAARLCQQVLIHAPGHAAANHLLGTILFAGGSYGDAVRHFSVAARAAPSNARGLADLGKACLAAGRAGEALVAFDSALGFDPVQPDAILGKGRALSRLGRVDDAIAYLQQVASILPTSFDVHFELGRLQAEDGDLASARRSLERAIELDGQKPQATIELSVVLEKLGRADMALERLEGALGASPGNASLRLRLGRVERNMGRLDAARGSFDAVLSTDPRRADAHLALAELVFRSKDDGGIDRLRSLAIDPGLPVGGRVAAGFALGRALSDLGRVDEAAEAYLAANALQASRAAYSPEAADREFAFITAAFQRDAPTVPHLAGKPPVAFIIGLPRAGKTTLERTLGSMPGVHQGGELKSLGRHIRRTLAELGSPIDRYRWSEQDLPIWRRAGARYLAELTELSRGAGLILDTMPTNSRFVGYIAAALPEARIIHCSREPVEHAAAIFEKLFTFGHEYSYGLGHLAHHMVGHASMMAFWRSRFPGLVLDIAIDELESDMVQAMGFLGLPKDRAPAPIRSEPRIGEPVEPASLVSQSDSYRARIVGHLIAKGLIPNCR